MATLFELAARIQAAGGGESLLLVLAKVTLILAIARLLLAALPRASAATRHLIATAALVGVAAVPVLTLAIPAWNVVVNMPAQAAGPISPTSPISPISPPTNTTNRTNTTNKTIGVAEEPPSRIGSALNLAKATGVVKDEQYTAVSRAMNLTRATWKGLIVVALTLVALLMLAQMVLGVIGVWFVAKNAEEVTHDEALLELDHASDSLALGRDVRLLRSSRISVPVLWGFFKPVLLLPADVVTWPAERLRVVLLHELAHLKRFDGISLILTRIAACIFWYHPLAWSLERAGRNDCERACDDLVLGCGTKPSDYADHLLAIARSMPTFDPFRSVTLAMSRKSQLEGRLLSILQPHVVRRFFSGKRVAIACAVVVACLVPLSAIRLIAEPSKHKDVVQLAENKKHEEKDKEKIKSDSTVTVTPDVQALEDYFLAKLGKYDKRLDKLAREPRNGDEWWDRAYNLYHNDRYEEAAEAFKRAAAEGHRPETSLYNAACSYALLGDSQRATATLKDAIAAGWDDMEKVAEDSDFDPIRNDATFQRELSTTDHEIATRRVTETMERYNDLRSGKTETRKVEAKRLFDLDILKHKDKDRSDWFEVGLDLLRLRRLDESIDAFQRSIDAHEKESTAMYNIACAYSLKGDTASAMAWINKAVDAGFGGDDKLANDPDLANVRQQRGFDELRQRAKELQLHGCCDNDDDDEFDNWRKAVEYHSAIVKKYPTAGRAWFNLGYVSLQAGLFDAGIDAFQRAINLEHRVGTCLYNIACAYAMRGDRDAAFSYLDKARNAGFDLESYLRQDDDLDNLHDDPRWAELRRDVRERRQ
ncbi:MAG TPA: M56 family metallopeptidase [Thermoanaerobaculia bacterium]|nr:M56 family metallopeptidase [Thermoanaerobaculia bacterium]